PSYARPLSSTLSRPYSLPIYLLPTPSAMVWLRALHVFLAGLLTYSYLRTLRLEPLPALGGGLVFALGSFLSAQMHHENVVRSAVDRKSTRLKSSHQIISYAVF